MNVSTKLARDQDICASRGILTHNVSDRVRSVCYSLALDDRISSHDSDHIGQLSLLRKHAGLPAMSYR
jgi:hypothetical protein